MSDKNIVSQSTKKFSDHYEDNPVTSVLLTTLSLVVPQIAIGKEVIDRAVTKIQKERFQTLIDELSRGEKYLTPEIIETEEFIHSFVVVYRAAINTYQREKIRVFAQILLSAIEKDELASERFETYVKLLETVTEVELKILKLLSEKERQYNSIEKIKYFPNNQSMPYLQHNFFDEGYEEWTKDVTRYIWENFVDEVKELYNVDSSNLMSLLRRLETVGLFQRTSQNIGTPTILYENFAEWIKFEDETNSIRYGDEYKTSD